MIKNVTDNTFQHETQFPKGYKLVSFEASSVEDVAFLFDSFSAQQKKHSCICFSIEVDKMIDTESVLEAARWLCASEALFVPTVPLEPSALFLLDTMGAQAISLQLSYPGLDDTEIKWGLLRVVLERLDTPVWIDARGLSEEQTLALQEWPVALIWAGVET